MGPGERVHTRGGGNIIQASFLKTKEEIRETTSTSNTNAKKKNLCLRIGGVLNI